MSMWSVPEAERPAGSPVTTGTTTVPTTTLGHVRIPRPSGTVSTTSSFTTCEGSGINGPLVARCKVIITAWAPDGHLQVVVTLVLEEVAMQRRSKKKNLTFRPIAGDDKGNHAPQCCAEHITIAERVPPSRQIGQNVP